MLSQLKRVFFKIHITWTLCLKKFHSDQVNRQTLVLFYALVCVSVWEDTYQRSCLTRSRIAPSVFFLPVSGEWMIKPGVELETIDYKEVSRGNCCHTILLSHTSVWRFSNMGSASFKKFKLPPCWKEKAWKWCFGGPKIVFTNWALFLYRFFYFLCYEMTY